MRNSFHFPFSYTFRLLTRNEINQIIIPMEIHYCLHFDSSIPRAAISILLFSFLFLQIKHTLYSSFHFRKEIRKTNMRKRENNRLPHFPRTEQRSSFVAAPQHKKFVPMTREEKKWYTHQAVCVQTYREVREFESTLKPLTERSPLRMHSLSPVPRTITSYSSSMVIHRFQITNPIPIPIQEFAENDESRRDEI